MDVVKTFYDGLAGEYDKLFADWGEAARRQAEVLERIFAAHGFGRDSTVLDCACGIGTQALGLAALGYRVTGSDISPAALAEARERARDAGLPLELREADFRRLPELVGGSYDIVIAMDNALPHLMSTAELAEAVGSIAAVTRPGGLFVASIRDYDALLETKPDHSPPYINGPLGARRIAFQTWDWAGESYRLVQYIIDETEGLTASRHECEYRALRRAELTALLERGGFGAVRWLAPGETGFYQPIVVAARG